MTTANGQYSYEQYFGTYKLSELIQSCHKVLMEASGWKLTILQPGQFGYDNLAVSISHALTNRTDRMTTEQIAELIHEGWAINYVYWRDHEPYLTNPLYKKPFNPLGDERRNKCADSAYADLDAEEQ